MTADATVDAVLGGLAVSLDVSQGKAWAEGQIEKLRADPLIRRYVEEAELSKRTERPFRHSRPWHALAEQRFVALQFLGVGLGEPGAKNISLHKSILLAPEIGLSDNRAASAIGWATAFLLADTYYWTAETEEASRAVPLPKHVIDTSQVAQVPPMFWSRPTAYGDGDHETNWQLLFRAVHSKNPINQIFDVVDLKTGELSFQGAHITDGLTWPTDFGSPEEVAASGQVLKKLAFLASPYIDSQPRRLSRADRKLARRMSATSSEENTAVRVVALRATANQPKSEGEPGEGPERHHRWWVRGHIRAQWYPSLERHRPIWIVPHIKGPEGAPFVEKMFAVVR